MMTSPRWRSRQERGRRLIWTPRSAAWCKTSVLRSRDRGHARRSSSHPRPLPIAETRRVRARRLPASEGPVSRDLPGLSHRLSRNL